MKGRLPNKARLEHSLDALKIVDDFINGLTFDDFAQDLKTTFAVVKALEIVGEAANHLTDNIQEYGIRPEILWRIITKHTAELKPKIQTLIDQLAEP